MSKVQTEEKHLEPPLNPSDPKQKQTPPPDEKPPSQRRRFTADYKARILAEADACEPGTLGALLQREGLHYANIYSWRKQQKKGVQDPLTPKKRSPTPAPNQELKERNKQLEKEVKRLTKRLADAKNMIELQRNLMFILNCAEKKAKTEDKGNKPSRRRKKC